MSKRILLEDVPKPGDVVFCKRYNQAVLVTEVTDFSETNKYIWISFNYVGLAGTSYFRTKHIYPGGESWQPGDDIEPYHEKIWFKASKRDQERLLKQMKKLKNWYK